jgi:hypothetical protein
VGTAIALALVTLGLVSGVAYLLARRRAGAEAASPVPTAATSETVGGVPAIDQQEGRWIRSRARMPLLGKVEGLIGLGSGFLAVGETAAEEGSQPRAAVWKGGNGTGWELLTELDPGRAGLGIPWRRGLLVIGTAGQGAQAMAATWWSGNGRTWQRMTSPDDPALAGVSFDGAAAGREAVVAYGRGPHGPGVWISADGERWVPSSLRAGIDLVARVGGGFLAFGRHQAERRPVVATSADGSSWSELTHDQVFMFEGVAMASVVGFEGGLVAAGTDKMRSAATVWVSDDGVRWHRTPFEPDPGTSIGHLILRGDRLLAVGVDAGRRRTGRPGTVAIWESTDAVNWERAEDSTLFATAVATDVAVSGESVLICGNLLPGRGSPWPEPVAVTWAEAAMAEPEEPSPPPSELAVVGISADQTPSA